MSTATASALTCSQCHHADASPRGWWHVLRYWGGVIIRPWSPDIDEWPAAQRVCGQKCAVELASALVHVVAQEEMHRP